MTRQEVLLSMLAAAEGREYHPVQIQKAMFLATVKLPELVPDGPQFKFIAYDYGAFDKEVYSEAEYLRHQGLARVRFDADAGHLMYSATEEGLARGNALLRSMALRQSDYLKRVSAWVIKLSFSRLVRAMYEAFPDTAKNSVFRDAR